MKLVTIVAGVWMAGCALASSAAEWTLVENGKAKCVIIVAEGASAEMAARDLKLHLDHMGGGEIPILPQARESEAPAGLVKIVIGDSALAKQHGITSENLGPEACRLKTVPGALLIVGRDVNKSDGPNPTSPALLYGTSFLLDRHLGVRWLWPGELGTCIPKRDKVVLPELDVVGQPPLSMRSFTTQVTRTVERSSTTRKTGEEAILWNHHHTIGRGRTELVFGHAFGKWWDKYHQTHPEYFAKVPPGRKQLEPNLVKLCVSEPGVARQIIAEWQEAGTPEFWNVCPNDDGGFCVCDNCRKLDGLDQDPIAVWDADDVNLNGRYVDLWNRLLVAMKKVRPDVKLCTYSYSVYKHLKPGTVLEPGLVIQFVGGLGTKDLWLAWSNAGAKVALRPNWLHFGGVAPHLPLHTMGDYFAFARANGMLEYHFDSNFGHYATQGPNYYLLARMGSRPDLGVEQVIDEWCSAYGAAAPLIRRYLDYWETYAAKVAGENKDGLFYEAAKKVGMQRPSTLSGSWRTMPLVYPDTVIQPALAMLQEAEEKAGEDGTVKARVEFLRDGLKHLVALREVIALTQGKDREVKERIPLILQKGRELLEYERQLTPRHVVYEAVLRSIYDKRGVAPFSKNKPIRIEGL
jgi:hypothetical protein